MISEQEKQAILNGAFGIDRAGRKMKYVGKSASSNYPNFIIVFNEHNEIMCGRWLLEGFTESKIATSNFDVVGLWEDKPEPFDLERALAGEPVMLRNGSKAIILKQVGDTLIGYFDECSPLAWKLNGYVSSYVDPDREIVGMWKEPEPVSNTVTVTLPRALNEPQDGMWYLAENGVFKSNFGERMCKDTFNRCVYFGAKEDAKAWFDAMRDNRR